MSKRRKSLIDVPPGFKLIFRPYRVCKETGQKLWARNYGYRSWPILVPE